MIAVLFALGFLVVGLALYIIIRHIDEKLWLKDEEETRQFLKYSFINNAILLKTNTIERNGFHEVWRQQSGDYSIQILCFNEKTGEFQAFDRFHWMQESVYNGFTGRDDYAEDLWTPIKLHYTEKWLKEHLIDSIN